MIKKLSSAFVAAAVVFAVGCGGGTKETKKDEPIKQEQAQPQPAPQPTPPPEPPKPPPPPPTCTNTQILDANVCLDVATALQGLRVEMTCKPAGKKPDDCAAAVAKPSKAVQIGGKAGQAYDITLQLRGVAELASYGGGTLQDFWNAGGKPSDKKANTWAIEVSAPAASYFVNAGNPGKRTWAFDYTRTIRVDSGATITLVGDSLDSKMVPNRDTKNVQQVAKDLPPFDGQFVQIDVVGVAPAR